MMDKKDIISKLAGYKLEGDIEGREKTIELEIGRASCRERVSY